MEVLGGSGAWPVAGQGCSGYLVAGAGELVLVDPGYGTIDPLLTRCGADEVTAVVVSHGHPDHCADLNPLLRARHLGTRAGPLPVYAPEGALDAVLGLDEPDLLDGAARLHPLGDGTRTRIGELTVTARALPHHVPNVGVRLEGEGRALVYTGDAGPDDAVVELARGADVLIAEATFPERVEPPWDARLLSTARQAGRDAQAAGVARLVLTHLWPGTSPADAITAARRGYGGPIDVAVPGLVCELSAS